MIRIVEYQEQYLENVRDLLVELEEDMIALDKDELDQVHPDYREKMALFDLQDIAKHQGKCFLAIEGEQVLGMIMGLIVSFQEVDYLDYKCPREGRIIELVVNKKARKNGIGKELMQKMEEYFKEMDCQYILIDVFAYNQNGIQFYEREGYHPRMITEIKKIS